MSVALEQAKERVEIVKHLVTTLVESVYSDEAIDAIHEDALSVEVRSGWRSPGRLEDARAEEFRIVLCTGGPHVELRGTLDSNDEPDTVGVFYSNWWESGWLSLPSDDRDSVLTYCRQFYFGE